MACTTSTSARRVITVSPPGRSAPASAAIRRSVLCIHSAWGEPPGATSTTAGSRSTSWRAAGWSTRTAPQTRPAGAPPPWRRTS